jgi:serine/threonine protein kinase
MIDDFLGPLPDRLLEEIAEKVHPKCKKGSLIDLEEEKSRYKRYQNPNDLFDYAFSEDYLRYKNDERFDPSHTLENFDLFKSFIKCFLTLDPAERLTIEAARVHPFMLTMQDLLPSKTA